MNKLAKLISPSPCEYFEEVEIDGKKIKHAYVAKSNGKLWPGVTTILKQWGGEKVNIFCNSAAKKAVMELGYFDKETWTPKGYIPAPEADIKTGKKHFVSTFRKIKGMKGTEYYDFLKTAKGAFYRKTKEAAESGTIAHNYIQNYVCEREQPKELAAKLKKDEKAKSSIRAFDKFQKEHHIEWLASELVVGSQVHEFGGTLDGIAYVDAIPSLVDFKTSNQISEDYFLQVAAYQIALEEMGLKVLQRIILRIPKDGGEFETITLPNNLENGSRLELDKMGFIALRQMQKVDSYYRNPNHEIKDENGKMKIDKKVAS
jgi:hypothetical protein